MLLILPLISSCFKTAGEIKREKNINSQIQESQKFDKEFIVKVDEFSEKITQFNGRLEEIEHKVSKDSEEQQASLKESIEKMEEQIKSLKTLAQQNKKNLANLKKDIDKQQKYVQRVNKSLSSINKGVKKKSSGALSRYKKANSFFSRKRYKQAKPIYQDLIENKKLKAGKNNSALLNLGIIEYHYKNYNDSLVYLSKIYTKYPNSSKAPSALYHIGLCFKALGQKEEAKETFKEVSKKYPKSKYAKKAKNAI